ncbi:hypothetical protein BaRGS_00039885 [Batillaria attramentaria]|uniref:Uncharacterized protein n=1 Tax=Batillaria attramentaria TaxID=370345 RepID=A0ABD0J227_9CAEN
MCYPVHNLYPGFHTSFLCVRWPHSTRSTSLEAKLKTSRKSESSVLVYSVLKTCTPDFTPAFSVSVGLIGHHRFYMMPQTHANTNRIQRSVHVFVIPEESCIPDFTPAFSMSVCFTGHHRPHQIPRTRIETAERLI